MKKEPALNRAGNAITVCEPGLVPVGTGPGFLFFEQLGSDFAAAHGRKRCWALLFPQNATVKGALLTQTVAGSALCRFGAQLVEILRSGR
ncbi:hypothetical protein Btus_1883 [Kyrpidia tusciae DSM 2912]|uniref:Uncharacterized protein n=1 Tax=Kyrpidia tusciae (strain DSM 2912 / NBRC 15312 / T2) TaxID=562970 RepID=D5WQH1_KYRT2|nr:hypothetical protein Btus_1883 [Kyrpidia tusciae DSM 2912]